MLGSGFKSHPPAFHRSIHNLPARRAVRSHLGHFGVAVFHLIGADEYKVDPVHGQQLGTLGSVGGVGLLVGDKVPPRSEAWVELDSFHVLPVRESGIGVLVGIRGGIFGHTAGILGVIGVDEGGLVLVRRDFGLLEGLGTELAHRAGRRREGEEGERDAGRLHR